MGFQQGDFCPFTKAVEHLGDRWSLLIIRELVLMGPQGFNTLADGLPGHISRSVLAERLRKLEELGLITRDPAVGGRAAPYCVTAGEQLRPVITGLFQWAQRFVPENPAVAERDPDLIMWWLAHRVDPAAFPERQVVLDLDIRGTRSGRFWLVLQRGNEPSACVEDPGLAEDRYVYVESDAKGMYPLARGLSGWDQAVRDGTVRLYGEPSLIKALPSWFLAPEQEPRTGSLVTAAV